MLKKILANFWILSCFLITKLSNIELYQQDVFMFGKSMSLFLNSAVFFSMFEFFKFKLII